MKADSLAQVEADVVACCRCPRLVAYRGEVARARRKQYSDWEYWGRPVPGFGDPGARLLIVGLAPAPHGGNRTGRVFTGDKSAEFLMRALHQKGFANQPISRSRDDGLSLKGAYITAAVKCVPPDNKPTQAEASNCSHFLLREFNLLQSTQVVLCLGKFAYDRIVHVLKTTYRVEARVPAFKHGLRVKLGQGLPAVFASYHPSPRNTQTGTLTQRMFQSLLSRIHKELAGPQARSRDNSRDFSNTSTQASAKSPGLNAFQRSGTRLHSPT